MKTTTTITDDDVYYDAAYRKYGWIGLGLILLVTVTTMTGILLWKSNLHPSQQDTTTTSTSSSLEGNTNDGENNNNDGNNNDSTTPAMDGDDDGNSSKKNESSPTPAPSRSLAPTITFPYDSYDSYYDTLLNIVLPKVYQFDDNDTFASLDINMPCPSDSSSRDR